MLLAAFAMPASVAAQFPLPEWKGPFPKAFTATSGPSLFEATRRAQVTCKADTASGEVTGPLAGSARITFTGCEPFAGDELFKCENAGAPLGEVRTEPLTTTLGYIVKASAEVWLELSPKKGSIWPIFECETPEGRPIVTLRGSVIGKLTPVNKKVKPPAKFTLKFAQKRGKQKPDKFEGGPDNAVRRNWI
jgi:hypothetical protein